VLQDLADTAGDHRSTAATAERRHRRYLRFLIDDRLPGELHP
jgi:hypothetical protein